MYKIEFKLINKLTHHHQYYQQYNNNIDNKKILFYWIFIIPLYQYPDFRFSTKAQLDFLSHLRLLF